MIRRMRRVNEAYRILSGHVEFLSDDNVRSSMPLSKRQAVTKIIFSK
jgi:hypothetical protein